MYKVFKREDSLENKQHLIVGEIKVVMDEEGMLRDLLEEKKQQSEEMQN